MIAVKGFLQRGHDHASEAGLDMARNALSGGLALSRCYITRS
jgi:hypothetical protein